jgi:hypothetical protein
MIGPHDIAGPPRGVITAVPRVGLCSVRDASALPGSRRPKAAAEISARPRRTTHAPSRRVASGPKIEANPPRQSSEGGPTTSALHSLEAAGLRSSMGWETRHALRRPRLLAQGQCWWHDTTAGIMALDQPRALLKRGFLSYNPL